MKSTEVHKLMVQEMRDAVGYGKSMNYISGVTANNETEARALCGKAVIVVTPELKTFVLGGGFDDWRAEATPEQIASLPDTRGEKRLMGVTSLWYGER